MKKHAEQDNRRDKVKRGGMIFIKGPEDMFCAKINGSESECDDQRSDHWINIKLCQESRDIVDQSAGIRELLAKKMRAEEKNRLLRHINKMRLYPKPGNKKRESKKQK